MKVLRYYEPGKVELEEAPVPEINSGEVLVNTKACGICATDLKTYLRGHPKIKPGAVLGHEVAGIIQESNNPRWKKGDSVVVAPYTPCEQCYQCKRGNYTLCEKLFDTGIDPGGFAEFFRVPQNIVNTGIHRLPEELDFTTASLAEPLACCIHGLETMNINADDTLLIIGDGPMGLLQAEVAKAMGVKNVVLSGMTPMRLKRAGRIADFVIDINQFDVLEEINKINPGGADKVMVSVGNIDVAESAFSLVNRGGTINLFAGLPKGKTIALDPNRIHYDEIKLLGTFGFAPQHFKKAIQLLADKKIHTEGIITATVPPEKSKEALDAVADYRGIKSIVVFP